MHNNQLIGAEITVQSVILVKFERQKCKQGRPIFVEGRSREGCKRNNAEENVGYRKSMRRK